MDSNIFQLTTKGVNVPDIHSKLKCTETKYQQLDKKWSKRWEHSEKNEFKCTLNISEDIAIHSEKNKSKHKK